jgi:hypothetical protein
MRLSSAKVLVHAALDCTLRERAQQGRGTVQLQCRLELNERLAIRRGEPVVVAKRGGPRRRTDAELGGVLAGEDFQFGLDCTPR